jgi:tRNA(fMet)-specific endonuclease VapC
MSALWPPSSSTAQEVLRAQEWLLRTERLLDDILVVPFDSRAAEHFDRLRRTPALRKIGRADLLVASIALGHRATLVTRSIRHFRPVPNLTIENWTD